MVCLEKKYSKARIKDTKSPLAATLEFLIVMFTRLLFLAQLSQLQNAYYEPNAFYFLKIFK